MDGTAAVTLSSGNFVSGSVKVGAELRAARERLDWDLASVAKTLRIRLNYLEALEQGRAADLPAAAYALGFVRSYATLLGLPAEAMCRRFREELGEAPLEPALVFPSPIRDRGVPFGAVALIAVAIAVGGYAGWYRLSEDRPGQVASVPPVPERLAPLAEPAQTASVTLPATSNAPASGGDSNADNPGGNQDGNQGADNQTVTPSEAAAVGVANPTASSNYEQAAGTPATSRVMLHANADSWLQVHDGSGNLLFSRILRSGETWQVPANAGTLYLTTGNAGGTDVLVDGQPTASLGGFGVVRHDLSLDPDQVKAGKLALPASATVPVPDAAAASHG